jgi:hypothetical protein
MSDTTDPGNRSAADIEADVERTRARVTQTIDALRDSMSPGQIMDQIVDYARDSGGADFTRNMGAALRDNPLPVLLIGAGIGWLMLSGQNGKAGVPARRPALAGPPASGPGMMERVAGSSARLQEGAGQLASSVGSAAGHAVGSVQDAVSSVASSASRAVSGMAGGVASAAGSAGESARAYRHDARHMAGQGMDAVSQTAGQFDDQIRQGWSRMSAEQPLVLGALGLALGAALGAMLPRTETEDRLVGEASDAVSRQVGDTMRQQYGQARDIVSGRVEEAREKLGQNASSASALGETVTSAAAVVTEAARGAARDLGEAAKGGMQENGRPHQS